MSWLGVRMPPSVKHSRTSSDGQWAPVRLPPTGDGDIGVDEIAGPHGELELAVDLRDVFEPAEGDRLYVAGVMR